MSLRLTYINAKGLNNPFKCSAVSREACTQRADLLLIQESHFVELKDNHLKMKNFPHIYYSNAASKKRGVLGVLLAIRDSVNFREIELHMDPNGRFIILLWTLNDQQFTLVNL